MASMKSFDVNVFFFKDIRSNNLVFFRIIKQNFLINLEVCNVLQIQNMFWIFYINTRLKEVFALSIWELTQNLLFSV